MKPASTSTSERNPEGRTRLAASSVLLILVGATFWPWNVAAQNLHDMTRPLRLVGLVAVLALVGLTVTWLLTRRGVRTTTVTYSVFVCTVMFMVGGRFVNQVGGVGGWTIVILVVVGFPILLSRMKSHVVPRILVVAVAVAAISGPVVATVSGARAWGSSDVQRSDIPSGLMLDLTPDIALFLLDGHPGALAWELDYPDEEPELLVGLEGRGFDVVRSAWSPYWTTSLAIPSLLNMNYPVITPTKNGATEKDLSDILSGDNSVMEILSQNGYRISVVGSGWSGLRCSSQVDDCLDAPLLNDVLMFTLKDSLVAPLLVSRFGHAFTHGVVGAMAALPRRIDDLTRSERPTMLMAHLIAPHPPPFLDPQCRVDVTSERLSVASGPVGVDHGQWNRFFLQHAACVGSFVLEMIDRLPAETLVVVVSDHGTDRRGQSVTGTSWGRDEIKERLNVVIALRQAGCELPNVVVLPNLFRRIFDCLSHQDLEDLPVALYGNPVRDLPRELVEEILDAGS